MRVPEPSPAIAPEGLAQPPTPNRYAARHGQVIDARSVAPIHPTYALALLPVWEREAESADYFAPTARQWALELNAALHDAGLLKTDLTP